MTNLPDLGQLHIDLEAECDNLRLVYMGGWMEGAGLAVHYKGRLKGRPIHVKAYKEAASGTATRLRAGSPQQLADRKKRVGRVRASAIPTAPILHIRSASNGFLLTMEDVATIGDRFGSGELPKRVSEALRALTTNGSWLHVDICPANVGIDSQNAFCFIDLESVYFIDQKVAAVSQFLTKIGRVPQDLWLEFEAARTGTGVSETLASRYHSHQLARLAMDMKADQELPGSDIQTVALAGTLDTAFWDTNFFDAYQKGVAPDVLAIADELDK